MAVVRYALTQRTHAGIASKQAETGYVLSITSVGLVYRRSGVGDPGRSNHGSPRTITDDATVLEECLTWAAAAETEDQVM